MILTPKTKLTKQQEAERLLFQARHKQSNKLWRKNIEAGNTEWVVERSARGRTYFRNKSVKLSKSFGL
jgi:hypothetical protein